MSHTASAPSSATSADTRRLDDAQYHFATEQELSRLPSSFAAPAWWKEAVVYQVWPCSFRDADGDGWGDVRGVIEKLDHIRDVGADVVWLSPVYKSPLEDFGYDVADYRAIDERFGSLADVEELIAELKRRGMKLMMDLVVNHTSEEHAWFQQSKAAPPSSSASPTGERTMRDWYIWRKGRVDEDGKRRPPNNWASFFGGSAWQYDEASDEWYLALFAKGQPDLNFENTDVREAVHDVMRFWLDKGVAGFRIDVVAFYSKVYGEPTPEDPRRPSLPDAPVTRPGAEFQPPQSMVSQGPRIHFFVRQMYEEALARYSEGEGGAGTITVGECPHSGDPSLHLPWTHPERRELNMIFNFVLSDLDRDPDLFLLPGEFDVRKFKRVMNQWQTYLHAHSCWHANYADNHDGGRLVSRWLDDSPPHRSHSAKLLAMWQSSQSGTLYLYQGTEIGMKNIPEDWPISEYKDVATQNFYQQCKALVEAGKPAPATPADIERLAYRRARDNGRLPVQWTSGPQAGFQGGGAGGGVAASAAKPPWMRVNEEDARQGWNVEDQQLPKKGGTGDGADDDGKRRYSVLEFWRRTLALRKAKRHALVYGNFNALLLDDERVVAYVRNPSAADRGEGDTTTASVLAVFNWSADDVETTLAPDEASRTQSQLPAEQRCAGPVASLDRLAERARPLLSSYELEDEALAKGANGGEPRANFVGKQTIKLRPYEGLLFELSP